ncbi:homing endonuclease associated repeat-containing protein [Halapricum desulfuricans]|uniref:homing endonuclease associated repeat-containing protein n=1 Tax=Halapricum desulfuricans TaxID=2841257 RepID=UPI001E3C8021|nr:hypothetical protein [Halapricum desulfuricans]
MPEDGTTRGVTTESECIEALWGAAEELSESPTKPQYEELGLTLASGTIQRVMGGWNDAKEAAGLVTYEQGENGGQDVQPKPDWVDLPPDKDWEVLSGNMRWYYKNRERDIAKKDRRRVRLRGWLHDYSGSEAKAHRFSRVEEVKRPSTASVPGVGRMPTGTGFPPRRSVEQRAQRFADGRVRLRQRENSGRNRQV